MSSSPTPAASVTAKQLVLTAFAEGALLVGIALFFIVEPQTTLTVVLAAIAIAIGLVVGVYAIYRAVPLMSEPATRTLGYLSIALIVVGPLMLFAVAQFLF
jgi:hypothetical protein